MKKTALLTAIVAAAMFAAVPAEAGAGTAKKKGSNAGKPAAEAAAPSGVQQLVLADQLAAWGDANKDPVALIAAAKIKASVGLRDGDKRAKTTDAKGAAPAEKPAVADTSSVESILTRARELAGDRQDLIAMADAVAAGTRGRVGGAARHIDRVRAGATDTYTMVFRGDEEANVGISGDGDTDLDLYVYDEFGNEICRSVSRGDDEVCSFAPAWTGEFRVKVKNLGGVYNNYLLLTD